MRFVSLFAGVGGFDLGFEAAGMECVGQVEIDKHAKSVLDKHWPDVPKHDDVVTAIEWAREIGLNGKVDLVCGGFPCQDLSVAGKRLGFAGERSSLFYPAIEFAQAVGAKQVVLENVPGLFSSNGGADFVAVINTLRESGFSYVEWRVFDSQFYGVPQRRRRVYIIASVGEPNRFPVFVESNSGSRDSKSKQEKGKATSTGIRDGIVGALCASDRKGLNNQGVDQGKYVIGKASFGDFKVRPLAGALTTAGDRPMTFTKSRRAQTADDFETWIEGNVSPTINAFDTGDVRSTVLTLPVIENMESETVRRLTPTEFERLQGFPDGWTDGQTDGHRYKQMGNAVTVNVTRAVGEMIMEANK
jgi:DNA (cytosine-5)-methyltransferase 1